MMQQKDMNNFVNSIRNTYKYKCTWTFYGYVCFPREHVQTLPNRCILNLYDSDATYRTQIYENLILHSNNMYIKLIVSIGPAVLLIRPKTYLCDYSATDRHMDYWPNQESNSIISAIRTGSRILYTKNFISCRWISHPSKWIWMKFDGRLIFHKETIYFRNRYNDWISHSAMIHDAIVFAHLFIVVSQNIHCCHWPLA